MEIREGMPQRVSNKTPTSFRDVAARFSKVEWKLLQEWQTELYEILMKEIHQALASLGPLIVTSLFSLRPVEKEDPLSVNHQDLEIRGAIHCSPTSEAITNSNSSLKRKAKQCQEENQEKLQWKTQYCPSTGPADAAPAASFNNGETYSMDLHEPKRRGDFGRLQERAVNTPVLPFKIKEEEEPYFVAFEESRTRERLSGPTEHEDMTVIIKEDTVTHSTDHEDAETKEDLQISKEGGSMRRKRKYNDCVKYGDTMSTCQAPLVTEKTRIPPSSCETEPHSRRQVWAGSNSESGNEMATLNGSLFMNNAYTNVQQENANKVRSDSYEVSESDMRLRNPTTYPQNVVQFLSTECENPFSLTEGLVQTRGSQSALTDVNTNENTPYPCPDYEQNHTGNETTDRRYSCAKCDKHFSQMRSLNRHQSIHSKERPYQCRECEKSFNRHDNLTRHQRSHSREFQAQLDMWSNSVAPYEFQN